VGNKNKIELIAKSIKNKDKMDEKLFNSLLKGNVVDVITTQNGSRNLQKLLGKSKDYIIAKIFTEVFNN